MSHITIDEERICRLALQNIGVYLLPEEILPADMEAAKQCLYNMLNMEFLVKSLGNRLKPIYSSNKSVDVDSLRLEALRLAVVVPGTNDIMLFAKEFLKFLQGENKEQRDDS